MLASEPPRASANSGEHSCQPVVVGNLPTIPSTRRKNSSQWTFNELFGKLPKRTASACAPQKQNALAPVTERD